MPCPPCPALPCPALPCPALPCPAGLVLINWLALSCLVLIDLPCKPPKPHRTWPSLAWPGPICSCASRATRPGSLLPSGLCSDWIGHRTVVSAGRRQWGSRSGLARKTHRPPARHHRLIALYRGGWGAVNVAVKLHVSSFVPNCVEYLSCRYQLAHNTTGKEAKLTHTKIGSRGRTLCGGYDTVLRTSLQPSPIAPLCRQRTLRLSACSIGA